MRIAFNSTAKLGHKRHHTSALLVRQLIVLLRVTLRSLHKTPRPTFCASAAITVFLLRLCIARREGTSRQTGRVEPAAAQTPNVLLITLLLPPLILTINPAPPSLPVTSRYPTPCAQCRIKILLIGHLRSACPSASPKHRQRTSLSLSRVMTSTAPWLLSPAEREINLRIFETVPNCAARSWPWRSWCASVASALGKPESKSATIRPRRASDSPTKSRPRRGS